jgi:DNA-binding NarL/FixJ family response regulator
MPSPQRILIAVAHGAAYEDAFKSTGWEVLQADDTHRVYSSARHNNVAAILIDTHLPRGGAETALSWLSANVHTAAIPVVVLTDGNAAVVKSLQTAGAQHCLPMNARPEQVLAMVHQCVGKPPAPTEAPQTTMAAEARISALRASGLLGSPTEAAYDQLTQLAARLVGAPIAALTLIDRHRQYLKSSVGIADTGPRELQFSPSFCQWVVSGQGPLVIEDARRHPVLMNTAAVRDMGVTAYAGVPVTAMGGQHLGALCAVDSKPRHWTQTQLDTLKDLAHLAEVLVARAMLDQPSAAGLADMKWYATAGSEAILGAVRILRRDDLRPEDRHALLDQIDSGLRSLMKIRASVRAAG